MGQPFPLSLGSVLSEEDSEGLTSELTSPRKKTAVSVAHLERIDPDLVVHE